MAYEGMKVVMTTTLVTKDVVDSVTVVFTIREEEGTEDTSTDDETPVEKEIPVPLE
ncbi:hypothetical protein PtrV1_12406 [Pyrenophora tritici-repentis]|uniref:Uncharacterized protein n=1 Tax=Pyrenophora tritici-repentis TaxID=45151 RepID=A0A2W1GX57_9PLEO|nr:hypothetical protein PtrV1_12406 [Pyrenophora tritici-repentis]KAF7445211.1 hypothetical protein A1F99_101970 [Pyrenophora tritici-repentis]KAF7565476.1 hypothetical protein PtrM4_049100 [Pyrenophora tritici-repentis]PZD41369.1 hypothetical protein A1F97_04383 [Pyrenophora tritici-repentis]